MNNYINEVNELLDKRDIHPEYRSFINKTLDNLAVTRNDEHLKYILGTPEAFVEQMLLNNEVYQPKQLRNEAESTSQQLNDEVDKQDRETSKLPKSKFYRTYNLTIMLAYKIISIICILSTLWTVAMLILRYHSYEVNITIISLYFAFLATIALIGLSLEQIRNVINSLLHKRNNLNMNIVKLIICIIILFATIQLLNISYEALTIYLPSEASTRTFDPITNFLIK